MNLMFEYIKKFWSLSNGLWLQAFAAPLTFEIMAVSHGQAQTLWRTWRIQDRGNESDLRSKWGRCTGQEQEKRRLLLVLRCEGGGR